jgi:hypothetical protein
MASSWPEVAGMGRGLPMHQTCFHLRCLSAGGRPAHSDRTHDGDKTDWQDPSRTGGGGGGWGVTMCSLEMGYKQRCSTNNPVSDTCAARGMPVPRAGPPLPPLPPIHSGPHIHSHYEKSRQKVPNRSSVMPHQVLTTRQKRYLTLQL